MEIKFNRVMELNDLISQFQNVDFDGDSEIVGSLQSNEAKRDFSNMFIRNLIEFDHKDELLLDYEHESIYGAYMLSKKAYEEKNKLLKEIEENEEIEINEIESIMDLDKNISADIFLRFNNALYYGGSLIRFKDSDKIYSYFELLVNQVLGLYNNCKDLKEAENNMIYTFENYGILKKKKLNKFTYDFYKK